MFLALTADQHFWDNNEDILFLGEWCKLYSQKESWSNLQSQTLSYHWDNREKLHSDVIYLDSLYEKYLKEVGSELNKILVVDHNIDYWRIIIGPWLRSFIEVVYDRYSSLYLAKKTGLVTTVWICDTEKNRIISRNFDEFISLICFDEYNLYLFSRLVELLSIFPYEKKDYVLYPSHENSSTSKSTPLKYELDILYEKILPNKINSVFFINSYLRNIDLLKINMKMCQLPHFGVKPNWYISNVGINYELRQKIKFSCQKDEFEQIFTVLIPEFIPACFIEDYHDVHKIAHKIYPQSPKVVYTANGYDDLFFTFWIASMRERGTRLIGTQHGGNFGSSLLLPLEDHQIKICNKYITWGWNKINNSNILPVATGKFTSAIREIHSSKMGEIIIIENTFPRYLHRISCYPFSSSFVSHIYDMNNMYCLLSENVRKILRIRLYPVDYGWSEAQRWHDLDTHINTDSCGKSYIKQLNESRLSIHTINSTTYLETFVANYPTILFWNPKYNEIRPEAQPYFDKLHDVGILHYTPESAAALINEIYDDPMKWWMQPQIQKAKDEFCWQFARTSDDWMDQLVDIMKKELAEVNAEQRAKGSIFDRVRKPKR